MADSMEVSDVSKLKVADLKSELKARGLSTTGVKNELVERLTKALQTGLETVGPIDDIELSSEINEDESFEDEFADIPPKQRSSDDQIFQTTDDVSDMSITQGSSLKDSNSSLLSINPGSSIKDSNSSSINQGSSLKDINSSESGARQTTDDVIDVQASESIFTENIPEPQTSLPEKETVPMDAANTEEPTNKEDVQTTVPSESLEVKSSTTLSDAERLEMRSKKYNVPQSDSDRKAARAQRFGVDITSSSSAGNNVSSTKVDVELLKKRAERFGTVVSPQIQSIEEIERINKRKERFGSVTENAELEVKKQKRAERFGVK